MLPVHAQKLIVLTNFCSKTLASASKRDCDNERKDRKTQQTCATCN